MLANFKITFYKLPQPRLQCVLFFHIAQRLRFSLFHPQHEPIKKLKFGWFVTPMFDFKNSQSVSPWLIVNLRSKRSKKSMLSTTYRLILTGFIRCSASTFLSTKYFTILAGTASYLSTCNGFKFAHTLRLAGAIHS